MRSTNLPCSLRLPGYTNAGGGGAGCWPGRSEGRKAVKAREVLEHFRQIGTWVDWKDTVDQFLHGDPEAEVRGMAAAWIPTLAAIRRAGREGANLFISHEPAFFTAGAWGTYQKHPEAVAVADRRRALLDELGMTVLRCHDTWDRMPKIGIPAAWARFLGFPVLAPDEGSYYRLLDVSGHTLDSLAAAVLEKARPLGQQAVLVYGRGDRRVERLAVGTGAITELPTMKALGADVLLATEDGMSCWNGGLWALDSETPLMLVSHPVAEFPGMMALAEHLAKVFPAVKASYIPVEFPWRAVGPR
jgi:putative NIF3 family GTP cyclohydrolase 1 type 2